MHPKLSVCIPAYNRPEMLPPLLESILSQDYDDYEVVICEDKSPGREHIRALVKGYKGRYPGRIAYYENEENLGYDGNLRRLIDRATGQYCFFMGNDDMICPGALKTVASALDRHPDIGVVLRSYASFDDDPGQIDQVYRYFYREIFFPAGPRTIATFYRRSVVIPGVVIHRGAARRLATDRFDGTLLYQLYLVANILVDMNGLFLPEIIVLYRNGGTPEFGNSEKEKGKFVPHDQTPDSSVHFMKGMIDIAAWVEKSRNIPIYAPILRDISNYSYPILAIQAHRPLPVFVQYSYRLAQLGLWRRWPFFAYFLSILLLGTKRLDSAIRLAKKRLKHTPAIGSVYRGEIGTR